MRLYIIKKNNEELYLDGVTSKRVNIDHTRWKYEPELKWTTSSRSAHRDIGDLNELLDAVIYCKLQAGLDDCEIITVENRLIELKSSIKLSTIRARKEQKAMMKILKND